MTKILRLEAVCEIRPGSNSHVKLPDWGDIELAIRRLDGNDFPEIALIVNDDCGVCIVGGGDRYVCEIHREDDVWTLQNPVGSDQRKAQILKNDQAIYSERTTADLDLVLRAARFYYEFNKPDPQLAWREP